MGVVDHRKLFQVVPNDVKNMWNEGALRGLILISLVLQITLILLGNVRRYNPRKRVRMALWCAYLSAYAVASAALGVITPTALDVCNTSTSHSPSQLHKPNTSEIMLFWAPFLLLHIGGPDAITAFALEDNKLASRHFVQILILSGATFYVLLLSWPGCSHLPQLSILICICGFIKCFERIMALRLANPDNLHDSMLGPPDPGPNYPKFMENFHLKKSQGFIVNVEEVYGSPLPANDYVYHEGGNLISEAYELFQTFSRLFVDLILTSVETERSQSYFRHLNAVQAFHVVEIELGFAFDMLYTKAYVVYTFRGLMLRLVSSFFLFGVTVGIYFLVDMSNYHFIDIVITYLLISVAILLEIIDAIRMLRSDWADHWLSQRNLTRDVLIFQFLKNPNKQRCSGSMAQFELLSVALQEKPAIFLQVQKFFGIDNFLLQHRYKTYNKVTDNLRGLIYSQICEFMVVNSDPKVLRTLRGSFSLKEKECTALLWSIKEVEPDHSFLIWYIATFICFYSDLNHLDEHNTNIYRIESKHISDYLMYLLVCYPAMLPIGTGVIRYRDTCAEAMRFFKEKGLITGKVDACNKLLKVDCLEVLPSKVKGDQCKSVLFDGCRLALTLKKMETEHMWKVTSQVWIEILADAAIHSKGSLHAQQLCKGGEFFTQVWYLMANLGITKQVQVFQGHARARVNAH